MEQINLKNKKILIVVAHCDDEIIFGGSLLTSKAEKYLLVIHTGGSRNKTVQEIANMQDVHLTHLKIEENLVGIPQNRFIKKENVRRIIHTIGELIKQYEPDYIFTHNEFGEYGHGHHRHVHKIVRTFFSDKVKTYYFGFAYPCLFNDSGDTFWPDTLKTFPLPCDASGHYMLNKKDRRVEPFRGLFRFKKYPEYFFLHTNRYVVNDYRKVKELASLYKKNTDSWIGWLRDGTAYKYYCTHPIQYFIDEDNINTDYVQDIWPENKKPREVFDWLLNRLHFEGKILWIGWNKFCIDHKYMDILGKYSSDIELLDKNESRLDTEIYGDQTVDYVGDICRLKGLIQNERYDSIICNGVLEYVDSIPEAVWTCSNLLKPHGRILIGTPGMNWTKTGKNRPGYTFIADCLKENDIQIISTWARDDYYYYHGWRKT